MGSRSYWFGGKRYCNKRGYYVWWQVSTVKYLREKASFLLLKNEVACASWSSQYKQECMGCVCVCVCVCVPNKWRKTVSVYITRPQFSEEVEESWGLPIDFFFNCQAHPKLFAFRPFISEFSAPAQ
jgi:hypothetical protein